MATDRIRHHLRVARRDQITDDVIELVLEPAGGAPLPAWSPGAHIDLILESGLVRQYSLTGDPGDQDRYRVAVLREQDGRGGSAEVHDTLHEGSNVPVGGPRNNFGLEPAREYLFIAGGIGITPIVPMIHAANSAGANWTLLYGGRTRASMAWATELATEHGDRVRCRPQDEYGLLDIPAFLGTPREGVLVYACGPEPMLRAIQAACEQWGPSALRLERFSPTAQEDTGEEMPFEVELASSGETFTIPPGTSIFMVLEEAGVDVFAACQEGTCRTCETKVISGVPQHRDSVLTAGERAACDKMMICVSRAKTDRLVLDI